MLRNIHTKAIVLFGVLASLAGSALGQTLIANPGSLNFSVSGNAVTPAQSVTIQLNNGGGSANPFFGPVQGAPAWLVFDNALRNTTNSSTSYSFSVDGSKLPAGQTSPSATIYFYHSSVSTPLAFPISVNSTGGGGTGSTLIPSASSLNFFAAPGAAASQIIGVSTNNGGAIQYTVSTNQTWLTTSAIGTLTAPNSSAFTITANASSLPANTYSGQVTLTPTGGGTVATVNVSFVVSSSTQFQVSPSVVTFNYQAGSGAPNPTTQVNLSLTTATSVLFSTSVSYTGGGQTGWLTVPVSGNTSNSGTSLTFTANPSSLIANTTYTAVVSVTGSGVSNSPLQIPVTLNVTGSGTLVASPASLDFAAQSGTTPSSRTLTVSSNTGSNISFTPTVVYTSPSSPIINWLQVASAGASQTTPIGLSVSVSTTNGATNLPNGDYTGVIRLTQAGTGFTTDVNVRLTVTSNPILTVSNNAVSFASTVGANPAAQTITASVSTSTGLTFFTNFTPNVGTPGNIITVTPNTGSLTNSPTTLTITPNLAGLGAGTYGGILAVSTTTGGVVGSPSNVQLTFTISGSGTGGGGTTSPNTLVIPGTLNFYAANGSNAIQEQSLTLNSATGVSLPFTLTPDSSSPWLSVSPSSGTTPTNVIVRVNTSLLAQGTTSFGTLRISGTGTTSDGNGILVAATTSASAQAQISPSVLSFTYQAGTGSVPTGQTISLNSTTGAALNYTVGTNSAPNWLQVSPTSGVTNGSSVVATLNSSALLGLGVGTYDGTITFTVTGSAQSSLVVPVKLVVTSSSSTGGGSGTLSNLVIAPAALNFFTPAGVNPTSQQVQVVAPTGTASYTAAASSSGGWLSINTNSNGVIVVNVNSAALATGAYNGSILITSTQLPSGSLSVPVNLTVTPTVALVPVPQGMVFNYGGGSAPPAQFLTLTTTNNSSVSYTISTTTSGGGGWLSVQGSGVNNAPTSLSVVANPVGLPAGVYTGTITINTTGTASSSSTVDVRLIVTTGGAGSSVFQFAPANLRFFSQVNGTQPPNQQVSVTSTGPATSYLVTTTVTSPVGGTWLQAGPANGTTPGSLSVGVNPFGLANGTYEGTVTVTGGGQSSSMPVQLVITNNPIIQTSTRSINFNYQAGAGLPPGRAIAVTTSNSQSLSYTASASVSSGSNWIQVTQPTSSTPGVFGVSLIQSVVQTLAAGTYNGTVTITASGAENSPLNIPVSLNINSAAQILLSSNAPLSFNAAFAGQAPAAQTVNVTSSGSAINVAAQGVTTSGGSWLTAILNTSVTPAILTVSTQSSGLSTGVYNGLVTLSSSSGAASVTIPVELNVSSQALLNVTPRELNFGGSTSSVQTQTLAISSTLGTVGYSISSSVASPFGGNWLQVAVNQATGSTPSQVQINVVPSGLPDGTYYGTVTVSASGVANSPIVIPVTLSINNATALVVTPTEITFTQTQGTTAPNPQTVNVTSQISTGFTVTVQSNSGNWLDVSPTTGLTSAILTVRPNAFSASLPPGRYTSTVTVSGTGSPNAAQFNVVLNVNSAVTLSANPGSLDFRARERSTTAPPTQTLQVNASGGANANIIASILTDRGGSWLNISPVSSSTPGTFTVGVNPAGLTAGGYTGTISFALSGAATTPVLQVRVSLTVDTAVTPNITSIANGASFQAGALAPGLVISLFGTGLGPDVGQGLQVVNGRVTRSVGGVRVLFDGIEAPILFVRNDQINCVVPYAMAGRAQASVQVDNNGVLSNVITPRLNDTAPGIFSLGGSQAAMLNGADNSINSVSRPVARGGIGVLYMTGEGALAPPGVDGEVTATIKRPNAPVSIRVGGVDVTNIQFAGAAPGLVQGVLQVNFVIPANAPTGGNVPIEVTIGTQRSQANMTIAVN